MEALRIVLTQRSANYRKEETLENKMTYPLPPYSTIIGALHNICGYKEYKEMDISIQGSFESMHREPYTDYCFLNSTMDDRGLLVKMKNESMLSKAYDLVAKTKKPQGSSYRKGITVHAYNEELFNEYRNLKDLSDKISEFKNTRMKSFLEQIKRRKNQISKKKVKFDKGSNEYKKLVEREKELKGLEKRAKEKLKEFETEQYSNPISKFRSLTTSLKYYEILDDIKLMIHVKAEKEVLKTIYNNIYRLTAIGRSEDFVEVKNAEIIQLSDQLEEDEITSKWPAYIDYNMVKNDLIFTKQGIGREINGTKYYLNKNYTIVEDKRIFKKVKVIYTSEYTIEEAGETVWIDRYEGKNYIVNFPKVYEK